MRLYSKLWVIPALLIAVSCSRNERSTASISRGASLQSSSLNERPEASSNQPLYVSGQNAIQAENRNQAQSLPCGCESQETNCPCSESEQESTQDNTEKVAGTFFSAQAVDPNQKTQSTTDPKSNSKLNPPSSNSPMPKTEQGKPKSEFQPVPKPNSETDQTGAPKNTEFKDPTIVVDPPTAFPDPQGEKTQTLRIKQNGNIHRSTLFLIYAKSAKDFSRPLWKAELDENEFKTFKLKVKDDYKIFVIDKDSTLLLKTIQLSEKDLTSEVVLSSPDACDEFSKSPSPMIANTHPNPSFTDPLNFQAASPAVIQHLYDDCGITHEIPGQAKKVMIPLIATVKPEGLVLRLEKETKDIPQQEPLIAHIYTENDSETPLLKKIDTCSLSIKACAASSVDGLASKAVLFIVGSQSHLLYAEIPIDPFKTDLGISSPYAIKSASTLIQELENKGLKEVPELTIDQNSVIKKQIPLNEAKTRVSNANVQ